MKKIVVNQAMSPDGTIISSRHRHDYNSHKDYDGNIVCTVDGGRAYIKRSGKYTDMTIYEDDPFEVKRRFFSKVNVWQEEDKNPKLVPLYLMQYDWLINILQNTLSDVDTLFIQELAYRNIKKIYDVKFPEEHPKFKEACELIDKNPSIGTEDLIKKMEPEYEIVNTTPFILINKICREYENMEHEQLQDVTPFDVLHKVTKYLE